MSPLPQPHAIGLLTPHLGGVFLGPVIAGAVREARRQGARLILAQDTPQNAYRSQLARDQVEGWIVVLDAEGAGLLASAGLPVVTLSCRAQGLPAVVPDNFGGMHAAVTHLIDHGHRRIVFLGRRANADVGQRFEGYKAALAERQIPFEPELVVDALDEMELGGVEGARALIAAGLSYTAIAAGTDKNALGALAVLQGAGYAVPDDIAVTGFDNLPQAQTADVPLTTVYQSFELLGSTAVARMLAQIAVPSLAPEAVYAPTALVTRRSCGCEPARLPRPASAAQATPAGAAPEQLARGLVQLLSHPFPLPAETEPAHVWPGVTTLTTAVGAALAGREPPDARAVEAAWAEAVALTTDLDVLHGVLEMIEQAGLQLLAAVPEPAGAGARLAQALRLMRVELLRARVAHDAAQIVHLDNILYANNEISTTMLGALSAEAPGLGWLRHTPALAGCLALWAAPDEQTELVLTSVFDRDGSTGLAPDARLSAAAYPPAGLLGGAAESAGDTITLLPLRTARRDWGLLAIRGPVNVNVTWNSDPVTMWGRMLAGALDRAALLAELAQQQEALHEQRATLQAAYERERVLSRTVRELGSPVIPLMDDVILLPLIGAIDTERAQQMIKVALEAVARVRATDVLIDITGVPLVDTQVAGALIQLGGMLRLLGARVMLVGVRPEIAQSIVGLGIDLAQIVAAPSLAEAMRLLRRGRARGLEGR